MQRQLLMLMAETPVHAGGSESLGAVDLPIQREAATGLPVIWGQSLKGALRQAARHADGVDDVALFGSRPPGADGASSDDADGGIPSEPEPDEDGERVLRRGSVAVGDAQLVLLPVAALRQCFAWLTSPLLLGRLARKAALLGVADSSRLDVRPGDARAAGTAGWAGTHVLGPFVAAVDAADGMAALGATLAQLGPDFAFTRDKLATDVVLVSDSTMTSASRMATDIVARVQLDPDVKTVKHGPFYSEHLPAETVLAALLTSADAGHLDTITQLLDGKPIQLGGDETIGKGVLWCRVLDGDAMAQALAAEPAASATAAATPTGGSAAATPAAASASASTASGGARPNPAAMPNRGRS